MDQQIFRQNLQPIYFVTSDGNYIASVFEIVLRAAYRFAAIENTSEWNCIYLYEIREENGVLGRRMGAIYF